MNADLPLSLMTEDFSVGVRGDCSLFNDTFRLVLVAGGFPFDVVAEDDEQSELVRRRVITDSSMVGAVVLILSLVFDFCLVDAVFTNCS